jgi:hypothetical protein
MQATFVETSAFQRLRPDYLDEVAYRELQETLMAYPQQGDVIVGTGGLRKLRRPDHRRGQGRRGGLRVIYYWWESGAQFWLFTLYDKNEAGDLTADQRRRLRALLEREVAARQTMEGLRA